MEELKGCPFCGGEPKIIHQSFGTVGVIQCTSCYVMFVFPWHIAESGNELYKVWNRRIDQ